jgi:site-specific recombinase XerD
MVRTDYSKPRTKENILEDREVKSVLDNCATPLESFTFRSLVYAGFRVSEFVHMRKTWVKWTRGVMVIPSRMKCNCKTCERELINKNGTVTKKSGYWQPKTPAGARAIPIVPEYKDHLTWFYQDHKEVMEVYPWRQYVNNLLNDLEDRSDLNNRLFPHCLRGTFATMLARKGFSPYEIKDVLGWERIEEAMYYVKVAGTMMKDSFDRKW